MVEILTQVANFVQEYLKSNDASHDWLHIERVVKNAKEIAKREALTHASLDLCLVEMAALLHDIGDYNFEAPRKIIVPYLQSIGINSDLIEKVMIIIENMSFRKELDSNKKTSAEFIERYIVQDADRLDAIGAIGIARCFSYGATRGTPLYSHDSSAMTEMTFEQYNEQTKKSQGTSLNHFYEKLFKLKDLMRTESGKQLAQERHEFMKLFVQQFKNEVGIN